jgi:chorismate mutase
MTTCDTLADVRSAIDQIDLMLLGLLAERGRYLQEATRFKLSAADVATLQGGPLGCGCRHNPIFALPESGLPGERPAVVSHALVCLQSPA